MGDEAQVLNQAIDQFEAEHNDGVISASRVINPLLQLWSLANAVDRTAALPIEGLLTALNGRKITTNAELGEMIAAVRDALAQLVAI